MAGPNGEKRRSKDSALHKLELTMIGLLWTALVSVIGFSIGGATSTARLDAHVETVGHPVGMQRVDGLEQLLNTRLQSIDQRLGRIERKMDGRD